MKVNGKDYPIHEMENKKFETTNQSLLENMITLKCLEEIAGWLVGDHAKAVPNLCLSKLWILWGPQVSSGQNPSVYPLYCLVKNEIPLLDYYNSQDMG